MKSSSIAEYRDWYQRRGWELLGHEAPALEAVEQLVGLRMQLQQQFQAMKITIAQIDRQIIELTRSGWKAS